MLCFPLQTAPSCLRGQYRGWGCGQKTYELLPYLGEEASIKQL